MLGHSVYKFISVIDFWACVLNALLFYNWEKVIAKY